jgi:polyisoprenoid-binding protein YceI
MNRHHRNTIAILISIAVCVGFSPAATISSRIISNDSVSSVSAPGLSSPEVRRYRIDASQSNFMVHAFVGGLLSSFGHNHNIAIKDISGETQFTDGTVAPASLIMRIKASSLAVTDKVSDSDRQTIEKTMREQVLETGKYPEITFNSTKIEVSIKNSDGQYQAKIWGDLTLHGVTHNVLINAQLIFDLKTLRARGEFSLKMTDYSIKPPSVAGGTITVKDTLKFNFNILSQ